MNFINTLQHKFDTNKYFKFDLLQNVNSFLSTLQEKPVNSAPGKPFLLTAIRNTKCYEWFKCRVNGH
jgi:hypothetical protein